MSWMTAIVIPDVLFNRFPWGVSMLPWNVVGLGSVGVVDSTTPASIAAPNGQEANDSAHELRVKQGYCLDSIPEYIAQYR